jgi:predicted transposase YbfD/YdcC
LGTRWMETFLTILREVRDPRDVNSRYELCSMLFIALAASLCGAKSCVDIADFADANKDSLAEIVDLPHDATPSHDSFSRLFRLLDPAEVAGALTRFARAMREGLGLGPPNGVVAVDGKRLKRGYERGRAYMPPLMVSVWDAETRVSIAAARAPGGNEVAGTLALLKTLTLKGCIVSADALHCHPAMAKGVQAAGGDYALGLKSNHGPLYAAAVAGFAKADAEGGLPFRETSERGHDREEWRCASVLACPKDAPRFPGLAAIGRIEGERRCRGKIETSTRYVALSTMLSPARLLEVVRAHWSVENNLHWQLDVSFHEDNSRTRKDHAPQNLSIIRRMALDMLRAHPEKRSIARKMKLACWSKEFFYELFAHMR